ncbi:hypothetical protein FA95DRAFT_1609482 [Auriscalpium vulgare]|uniref:Uncharacterized protein n=1 Tax=Auriscalpium vulgare TaxID=40419 RepID=A0ACB8RGT5_9AGAM|nr:hypothetical protein FA95DRAFT_1609482 [Auriscalpium vulgare]
MRPSFIAAAVVLFSARLGILAANDWNLPCLDGHCSYDLPSADSRGPVGTLNISGSLAGVSDITHAAGWAILHCDGNSTNANIHLSCKASDPRCDHLFQGGAEGTIVRLPESCGKMPFARVARAEVHSNSSTPVGSLQRRQDGIVWALDVDTDFAAADARHGNVSFTIQGSTVHINEDAPANPRRFYRPRSGYSDRRLEEREIVFEDSVKLRDSRERRAPSRIAQRTFEDKISVDVNANVHATVVLGFLAAGSLIPRPTIGSFSVFADLDGNLMSTLHIQASAEETFDSGPVPIFEVGIPGLEYPGFLTIGPEFKIAGQVNAELRLEVDAAIDLNYDFDGTKLVFPPQQGTNSSATKGSSPISGFHLSANPSAEALASVEAHLIPTVDIGITAFGTSASIFLNLDASAKATLNATASASASGSTDASGNATASVQGCLDVGATFSINAGAQGSFFGLFDDSTKDALFNKDFDLYSKCLQAQTGSLTYDLHF